MDYLDTVDYRKGKRIRFNNCRFEHCLPTCEVQVRVKNAKHFVRYYLEFAKVSRLLGKRQRPVFFEKVR